MKDIPTNHLQKMIHPTSLMTLRVSAVKVKVYLSVLNQVPPHKEVRGS